MGNQERGGETKIDAAEMWIYRRILRISWRERRTNNSVLEELGLRHELLNKFKERKLSFLGHQLRLEKSIFQSVAIKRKRENVAGRGLDGRPTYKNGQEEA